MNLHSQQLTFHILQISDQISVDIFTAISAPSHLHNFIFKIMDKNNMSYYLLYLIISLLDVFCKNSTTLHFYLFPYNSLSCKTKICTSLTQTPSLGEYPKFFFEKELYRQKNSARHSVIMQHLYSILKQLLLINIFLQTNNSTIHLNTSLLPNEFKYRSNKNIHTK